MRKPILFGLLALTMVSCQTATDSNVNNNPVLTIEGGQVQGVNTETDGVVVYRGIPYADAPIGDLRWKAPQPVKPWEGVKVCDRFANPSYQHIQYKGGYYTEWGYGDEAPFSEDCLYLNVWTKASGDPSCSLDSWWWLS